MHAGHQEFVVAGVLHNALAALGGFRLVHVVVGIDFGVVLLQGVTVHQVADDNQVCKLEGGVARCIPMASIATTSQGESRDRACTGMTEPQQLVLEEHSLSASRRFAHKFAELAEVNSAKSVWQA